MLPSPHITCSHQRTHVQDQEATEPAVNNAHTTLTSHPLQETTEPAVNLVVLAGLPSLAGTCAGFIITFTEAEKMFNAAMRMRAYRHLEAHLGPAPPLSLPRALVD